MADVDSAVEWVEDFLLLDPDRRACFEAGRVEVPGVKPVVPWIPRWEEQPPKRRRNALQPCFEGDWGRTPRQEPAPVPLRAIEWTEALIIAEEARPFEEWAADPLANLTTPEPPTAWVAIECVEDVPLELRHNPVLFEAEVRPSMQPEPPGLMWTEAGISWSKWGPFPEDIEGPIAPPPVPDTEIKDWLVEWWQPGGRGRPGDFTAPTAEALFALTIEPELGWYSDLENEQRPRASAQWTEGRPLPDPLPPPIAPIEWWLRDLEQPAKPYIGAEGVEVIDPTALMLKEPPDVSKWWRLFDDPKARRALPPVQAFFFGVEVPPQPPSTVEWVGSSVVSFQGKSVRRKWVPEPPPTPSTWTPEPEVTG